jgi:phage terminase large subunit-like protein
MYLNYNGKNINHEDTPAYRYAAGIAEGKKFITIDGIKKNIQVGKYMRLAVERFFKDIEAANFELDWDTGYRPIKFAEKLCHHHKGKLWAGKPFILEPNQHFTFLQTYGWRRSDGTRRIRRSFKTVARKNGKTSEKAIEALYHLIVDGSDGAQIWCGATKEEQARILVNDAGSIARKSPALRDLMEYYTYQGQIKRVSHKTKMSFIAPLGRDSNTQDGFDPSQGYIDEWHAHKTDDTANVIESGMGAQSEPLMSYITTAGVNKSYPCFAVTRKFGIDILENKLQDDSQLITIFELDKDDEWDNPDNYIKANPNLGASVNIEYFLDRLTIAKNQAGTKEVDFKTKNLNMWVDAPDVWIQDDIWQKNTHGINPDALNGEMCWGGLDLAGGTDFNAFVLIFPRMIDGVIPVKAMFWLPSERVKNRKDGQDFTNWVDQGYIKTTPGNIIDYDIVVGDIMNEISKYQFQSMAYDRAMAHSGFAQDLMKADVEMFEVSQYILQLSAPTKEFEILVSDYRFEHFNNPVMRWMMGNAVIQQDSNNNIKINKQKSFNKIDGIAALINAIAIYYTPAEEEIEPQIFSI